MVTPRLAAYGVGALAVLAVLAGIYTKGYTSGKAHIQTLWDADKAAVSVVVGKVISDNIKRETEMRKAVTVAEATAREGISNVETQYASTLASLRAGNLQLRKRFTACTNALPGTPADPGQPADTDGAGLAIESAKRIVRAAADGDRGIIERNQCVTILKAERAQNGDSN